MLVIAIVDPKDGGANLVTPFSKQVARRATFALFDAFINLVKFIAVVKVVQEWNSLMNN